MMSAGAYHMTAPDKEGKLNMDSKKICPMKLSGQNVFAQTPWCEEENCAWWCDFDCCCALVSVSAEISDWAHDLQVTLER